jgi:cellulose synthase/poly-beta-1,6-N-acetylglucosamine synthase-like glycosyltransferase
MNVDILFLTSLGIIWIMLLYYMFLAQGGFQYALQMETGTERVISQVKSWPSVSIFIPAHNEAIVIKNTLEAMIQLDYPKDRIEIIVINDKSTDQTGAIVDRFAKDYPCIKPIHVAPGEGGKGKSGALNRALNVCTGEFVVVYDADNTPERMALKNLVAGILNHDPNTGAVVGKFRVINAKKNILTRFINIETINFQWMAQAGRWKWFHIATIPGTNFLIRRSILEELGGWDEEALAEDTELSIRVYELGYSIRFWPAAITWEQEPETWSVWFKQRTRWAQGNQYVIMKYLPRLLRMKKKLMQLDLFYFFITYFLFLGGVVTSNLIFLLGLFGLAEITVPGPYLLLWILAYVLFVLEIMITLRIEKTELNVQNFVTVLLMYLTYAQLWLIIVVRAIWMNVKVKIKKQEVKWEKTQRFS